MGGCAGAAGGGGPSTGSGRTGVRSATAVGSRGRDGGGGWGCPARRTSGYRLSPVRRWRVYGPALDAGVGRGVPLGGTGDSRIAPTTGCGGVGDAMGVGDGGALPGAPLDTGFRRYDDCGCAGQQVLLVSEWGGPAAAGRAIRESPLRCVRGVGNARGGGWGVPRPAHLWIPAFAGTTMAGERVSEGGGWRRVGVPLRRDGRFANRPYGALGESGMRGGCSWGVPRPFPSGFLPSQE